MNIDDFDFFELLGLESISDEQKELRLSEIESLVLHGMLMEDLPKHLKEEDLKDLEKYDTKEADPEFIYDKFRQKIPQLDSLIYQRALKLKKNIILDHIRLLIKISEKRKDLAVHGTYPKQGLSSEKKVPILEDIENKLKVLHQVLEFYEKKDWAQGLNLIKQIDARS